MGWAMRHGTSWCSGVERSAARLGRVNWMGAEGSGVNGVGWCGGMEGNEGEGRGRSKHVAIMTGGTSISLPPTKLHSPALHCTTIQPSPP